MSVKPGKAFRSEEERPELRRAPHDTWRRQAFRGSGQDLKVTDRVRTEAFRRAIEAVVRPGDVVLDIGAGSGILSLFAARAGAARVYAVERTTVAALAERLAAANGVAAIIQVFHGDVMDIELPGRVDVIVSEWLGGFGIDEGMLFRSSLPATAGSSRAER